MSLFTLKTIFNGHVLPQFWGRAKGAHQFGVEFLRRPPPVHGHQGLCGCGDAVAIQVELALSVRVGARASLGAGGNEAAGPRIHLFMRSRTRHWRDLGTEPTSAGSSE